MDFPGLLRSRLPVIKIVDVGAMNVGNDTDPYSSLLRAFPCEVVGFEPVVAECEKLNAAGRAGRSYLPYFIGDGGKHTFYECKATDTSSLFEPNTALLEKFQNLANLVTVVSTSDVETKRLDDIPQAEGADYLKIDVQGAELLVLQGAKRVLAAVGVVHVEVEFVELYKNQPLFADIDAALRQQGFSFHRFETTMGRTFRPMVVNKDVNAMLSQMLWGDAIYVKDFMAFAQLGPLALLKLAAILHENYRSYDLAAVALRAYDQQTQDGLHEAYMQFLMRGINARSPSPV